jgi:Nif-specific regulatory protein
MERVKYKLGEGITGRVIETGKAWPSPKSARSPCFSTGPPSRKMKMQKEISFICVPVKRGKQVIGAISVDKPYDESYSLKSGKKLMSVVATMIAQHVINLETIRMEKEQLREETGGCAVSSRTSTASPTSSATATRCGKCSR